MEQPNYSTIIESNKTQNEIYTAINNVHLWWSDDFKGNPKAVDDEFTVTFGETYMTLKVSELVNDTKVVWEVTDCYKHFVKNKREWVGTKICFDIVIEGNEKPKIVFTHFGLSSPLECFEICCDGWDSYLQGSLKKLII